MVDEAISYEDEFEELKCIGRGNFGAAFLVKHKNPPQGVSESYFIAKKIILGQLTPREQEQALLEAQLLRNLNHINIVSYKCSFIDKDVLIIIMEFCEMGDLAYHVKKKRNKGETFSEVEIMNWFLQICMALEYVHGRKILHRDLKSQNIFLTANNTIKLGDFGISKVLESTHDQALTVQGTPYYMSPEVCQSQPYTYTSDVWALGCILYELCTLKHAFSAENLLGLVFKIVQDKQDPIPNTYSADIRNLVSCMLNKDEKKRPQVIDILRMSFVQQHMRTFVESQGKITLNPKLSVKKEIQPQLIEQEIAKDEAALTPAERARMRKAQRAEVQFQQLKQAAAEARLNASIGQTLKQKELSGSGSLRPNNQPVNLNQTSNSDFNEVNNRTVDYSDRSGTLSSVIMQHPKTEDGFYKHQKSYLQNSGKINVQFGGFEDEHEQELPSHNEFMPSDNFSSKADLQKFDATGDRSDFGFSQASSHFADTKEFQTQQSFDLTQTVKQYLKQTGNESVLSSFLSMSAKDQQNFIMQTNHGALSPIMERTMESGDNRKLTGTGHYKTDDDDDYSDDFEDSDESQQMGSTGQTQKIKVAPHLQQLNRQQLDRQVQQYQQMLDITNSGFSQYDLQSIQQTLQPRLSQQKELIKQKMGGQLFDKVLKILEMHKQRDSNGSKIAQDLRSVTQMSADMKDLCFALEQIVFKD